MDFGKLCCGDCGRTAVSGERRSLRIIIRCATSYRQAQILARQGVILERSTLSFWMGYAAAEVAPVVARLREMMLASTRIFADETVVPVLDPGRGRTKQGYFWAMARDDRPWGGSQPPAVVYSYAPGRGHTHANTLLGGYRGILQCDGYAAYKKFAGSKSAETSVTLAFCWSHVRRGFYDLAKAKAPIATETLQRIAALYEIEARVRGKSAADRLAVRQTESKPLVTELRDWFEAQIAKLPARGPTADAIRYALNHWDGLCRFLDDGRIELDNNSVERSMRPVALSRKNSLFAGSDEGGENWACLASLIETCLCRARHRQVYAEYQTMPSQLLKRHSQRECRGSPLGIVLFRRKALNGTSLRIHAHDTAHNQLQGSHLLSFLSRRGHFSAPGRQVIHGQTMPNEVHMNQRQPATW